MELSSEMKQEDLIRELKAEHDLQTLPTLPYNPWTVNSLDEFLYYCCPECNFKSQLLDDFNGHAIVVHPMAREALIGTSSEETPPEPDHLESSGAGGSSSNEGIPEKIRSKKKKKRKKAPKSEPEPEENIKSEFDEDYNNYQEGHSDQDQDATSLSEDVKMDMKEMYEVIGTKVGTMRFKCSVCSHKSRYKQGVIDHVKQVHRKERPFECSTCTRSFFRKTDLKIHIANVHDGKRQWICDTCGHACSSKQSLHKHKINQHTKSPYHCIYCKFVGPSAKRFYNHYSKLHSSYIVPPTSAGFKFNCESCPKGYEYENLLKLHMDYEHNNIDKMACDKCGKQFSTKSGLKFHVAGVHEGLKPYVCSQCGKSFPTNGSMQTHIKIVHLKTGSVKCELCQQGVANIFYLRKHIREVHPDVPQDKYSNMEDRIEIKEEIVATIESNIEQSNIELSNIEQSNIEQTNIEQSNIELSNIEQSNIEQTNIEQSNIEQSNIKQTNIEQSNSKPVINNNAVVGEKIKLEVEEDEPELMYRHCYRCPECPFRHEAKHNFIAHALMDHPQSHNLFLKPEHSIPTTEAGPWNVKSVDSLMIFSCCKCSLSSQSLELIQSHIQAVHQYLSLSAPNEVMGESDSLTNGIKQEEDVDMSLINDPNKLKTAVDNLALPFPLPLPLALPLPEGIIDPLGGVKYSKKTKTIHTSPRFLGIFKKHKVKTNQKGYLNEGNLPQCKSCLVYFLTVHEWKNHTCPKPKYPCESCGLMFNRLGLRTHQETCLRKVCPHCKFTTYLADGMEKHMESVHTDSNIKCNLCTEDEQQLDNVTAPLACKFCQLLFESKHDLLIHVEDKYTASLNPHKKNYLRILLSDHTHCRRCHFRCIGSLDLDQHLRAKHDGEPMFDCTKCDTEWCSVDSLRKHFVEAHDYILFFCCFCNASRMAKDSIDKHIQNDHAPDGRLLRTPNVILLENSIRVRDRRSLPRKVVKKPTNPELSTYIAGRYRTGKPQQAKRPFVLKGQCAVCKSLNFKGPEKRKHLDEMHVRQCVKCLYVPTTYKAQVKHNKETHNDRRLKCHLCPTPKHKAKIPTCTLCQTPTEFTNCAELLRHIDSKHPVNKELYPEGHAAKLALLLDHGHCDVVKGCNSTYSGSMYLDKHASYEHGIELNLECSYCSSTWSCVQSLKRHLAEAHQLIRYPCQTCFEAKFKSAKELDIHRSLVHGFETVTNSDNVEELEEQNPYKIEQPDVTVAESETVLVIEQTPELEVTSDITEDFSEYTSEMALDLDGAPVMQHTDVFVNNLMDIEITNMSEEFVEEILS